MGQGARILHSRGPEALIPVEELRLLEAPKTAGRVRPWPLPARGDVVSLSPETGSPAVAGPGRPDRPRASTIWPGAPSQRSAWPLRIGGPALGLSKTMSETSFALLRVARRADDRRACVRKHASRSEALRA